MLGRRVGFLVDGSVGGVDALLERRLYRLWCTLRHFVPPAVQLAEDGLGRNGAGECPRSGAADTVGYDHDEEIGRASCRERGEMREASAVSGENRVNEDTMR